MVGICFLLLLLLRSFGASLLSEKLTTRRCTPPRSFVASTALAGGEVRGFNDVLFKVAPSSSAEDEKFCSGGATRSVRPALPCLALKELIKSPT